jgi:hypothetical protein
VSYQYRALRRFWNSFRDLEQEQQTSCRRVWRIFHKDPFDPRLKTHRISTLSARAGRPVYAVWIEPNLRVVFFIEDDIIYTMDVGTHKIYR